MAYDPSGPTMGPSEQELRILAADRAARRMRSFKTSSVLLGSLIVVNLLFYTQSHNGISLLLAVFMAASLGLRAWGTFGMSHKQEEQTRREAARLRASTPLGDTSWPVQPPMQPITAQVIPPPPLPRSDVGT